MLTVLVDDVQIEVQLAAMRALSTQAGSADAQIAREALDYSDDQADPHAVLRVRHLAILALGAMGFPQDSVLLYNTMADESEHIRITTGRAVIDYLKNMRKPVAAP